MLLGASLITVLLVGTAIAAAFGVAATCGFDWIETIIQVALASSGSLRRCGTAHIA
jgi:hypothetical protein